MPGKMITSDERIASFIGWAFVIAIGIHLILAAVFPHQSKYNENQQVEKVSVTKKIIVKVPTPPPPTPTPPPTATAPPQTNPQPQLKVNVPKTTSNSSNSSSNNRYIPPRNGTQNGVPQGQGTAAPHPTAPLGTPKPACRDPYMDATVIQQVSPDYPESARELGLGQVTVQVQVTISPSGSLIGTKIFQSGGNMSLDQAAISAARQSTYSPKVVNCEPITGDYLFKVTFDPNQ